MSLKSMTAYGFGEHTLEDVVYTVEVRTLNSRFMEVNVRLPRHLIALETEIINVVKTRMARGKADVFVDVQSQAGSRDLPEIDPAAVRHYADLFDKLQATLQEQLVSSFATLQDPTAADFFRLEGVLKTGGRKSRGRDQLDESRQGVMLALDLALTSANTGRSAEGQALGQHLTELLDQMDIDRAEVAKMRDEVLAGLFEQVKKRLDQVLVQLEKAGHPAASVAPERLAQEVALISDKADIEEEIARLKTHMDDFRREMATGQAVGRKLDFLCQELHREVNTMSNKLVQTPVAKHTLSMKQTIERIKQQVQNIE